MFDCKNIGLTLCMNLPFCNDLYLVLFNLIGSFCLGNESLFTIMIHFLFEFVVPLLAMALMMIQLCKIMLMVAVCGEYHACIGLLIMWLGLFFRCKHEAWLGSLIHNLGLLFKCVYGLKC